MTWVDIAFGLPDKYDYIAFAMACRDNGIAQQFRPRDYEAVVRSIDAFVQTGLTYQEGHERIKMVVEPSGQRIPASETNGAPCGGCGGGKVI